MKKIILVSVIAMVGAIICFFCLGEEIKGKQSYEIAKYMSDVVGTTSGTSTTYVAFSVVSGGNSATSSYVSKIGRDKEWATYMFWVYMASTSASNIRFDLQGSNDSFCDATATSTTDAACVGDCFLTTEVHWFDASDHYSGSDSTVNLAPITFVWNNPTTSTYTRGDEILLTNLNYECLRMNLSASSTELYVGLTTK
jgi:hypothetical protein